MYANLKWRKLKMIEYKFKTYGELVDFLNKRKDDKRACYYF